MNFKDILLKYIINSPYCDGLPLMDEKYNLVHQPRVIKI